MKNLKNKKGVSLIVLIITIIIMIILATAIILSISNTGIIDKATKAKQDSDNASLKEYVNVLQAEWELMSKTERVATGANSSVEYVNARLASEGYNRMVDNNGVLLPEGETSGVIEIGDEIRGYNNYLTQTTKETSGNENTAPTGESSEGNPTKQNVSNRTNFVWKYIGMNDNGEIMIVPVLDEDSPTIHLSGKGGYLNGPSELDEMCDKLYSVTGKGTARSINIDHIYSSEKGTEKEGFCLIDGGGGVDSSLTIAQLEEQYNTNFDDTLLPEDKFDLSSAVSTLWPHSGNVPEVFAMDCPYWIANQFLFPRINEGTTEARSTSYCAFGIMYSRWFVYYTGGPHEYTINDIYPHEYGILFTSYGEHRAVFDKALCPIVTLNSNVTITKVSDGVWQIN